MNPRIRLLAAASILLVAAPSFAQITFYEHDDYRGRTITASRAINNFKDVRFNDTASSISIDRGTWEVCEDVNFRGRCEVLRPGGYPSMGPFGMNDRISSARPLDMNSGRPHDNRPPDYAWGKRPNERLYEAEVTSVRAVYGEGNRRCWNESNYSNNRRSDSNVGGAILGGIIGGIIGHQIGDGSGRTAATVGGAAIGAAVGSKAGRDNNRYNDYDDGYGYERGLRRCENNRRGQPTFWDVSYVHRGTEHWVRLNYQPGRTITVNRQGEPRD